MPFGLHPSLAAIHPLFDSGNLAVVCNVGPLVEPLTRESYLSGAPRPYQLFSHSDQIAQWQSSISTGPSPTGWGGRIADTFGATPGMPVVTALAGGGFTRGQITSPLSVAAAPTPLNQLLSLSGFGATPPEVARRQTMDYPSNDRSRIGARSRHAGRQAKACESCAGPECRRSRARDGIPQYKPWKSAEADCKIDSFQLDVCSASQPADLLLFSGWLRYASESGEHVKSRCCGRSRRP